MLGHRTLTVEDYITVLKRRWWILAIPGAYFPDCGRSDHVFPTPRYTSASWR